MNKIKMVIHHHLDYHMKPEAYLHIAFVPSVLSNGLFPAGQLLSIVVPLPDYRPLSKPSDMLSL